MEKRSKSRNNSRIERNNDENDIDLLSKKKDRHGNLIKNQELKEIEDNNNNNISVMIEDNKKEENEKEDGKKDDDKIENDKKINDKIEDDKEEDDKIENKVKNDKIELKEDKKEDNKEKDIKKRCCLRCKNNQGCCICLNKQYKCTSCLYFYYINNLRKREQRPIELEIHPKGEKYIFPRYPLFPPDNNPYQDIELRSFHSVERENSQIMPIIHRSLANTNETSSEDSQTSQRELDTPFLENGRNNKKRSLLNIILCILYSLCLIYFTTVFRNANGFNFRATTSLYVMIVGLFAMFLVNSLQNYFK